MKKSHMIAAAIVIVVGGWVASGQWWPSDASTAGGETPPAVAAEAPLPEVRVRHLQASPHTLTLVVTGQTAAARRVTLRAEIAARVVEAPAEKGASVRTGAAVVRLAPDDRPARLTRAESALAHWQREYDAARQLGGRGFMGELKVSETRSRLDDARAEKARIETEIAKTTIRAPFAGVVDTRPTEIGDFVDVGDTVATLLELDPLLVVAHVAEREVGALRLGGAARLRLISGEAASGSIRYIARSADAATRTFRVEIEMPNPDGRIAEGLSTEVFLPTATLPAHRVSPALLSLADDGTVGVKLVDDGGTVRFMPVQVLGAETDGVWLGGLPETLTLITVGQEFVKDGQKVTPVAEPS